MTQPIDREKKIYHSKLIYHSFLLCCFIAVTGIESTCPLTMFWPCTKTQPANPWMLMPLNSITEEQNGKQKFSTEKAQFFLSTQKQNSLWNLHSQNLRQQLTSKIQTCKGVYKSCACNLGSSQLAVCILDKV